TVNFFDSKAFWLPDGTPLPFGHYSLKEIDEVLESLVRVPRRITGKRTRPEFEDLERELELALASDSD
ncbi:MAG: hypothetical protein QGG01_00685, partial [Roseibacillus sp.]|nr:hypothetical protein [Roseibacillus sp.]